MTVPVCDRAIACERPVRPSFSAMTGLPASRALRAAAKNAAGRRIFSSASTMTLVSGSSAR